VVCTTSDATSTNPSEGDVDDGGNGLHGGRRPCKP
jgi:hypothetical protein